MRLRPVVAVSLVLTGFLVVAPAHASCGVSGVRGTDPGHAALSAEIDRAAARRQVPPYLLKAVAWQESKWRQFDAYGRITLSPYCAIGVMQVLPRGWDAGRLARDWKYNVDAGAQMLAAKMAESSANVPRSLGADDKRVAENWYRAVYRYNGSGGGAVRYADLVFATSGNPPSDIRPWFVPVAVANPRSVISGYSPTSGHGYVARLDGTWVSTLGTYHHAVTRGDYLAGSARMSSGGRLESDQRTAATFLARNLGWATWTPSRVSLSTQPVGRGSRLRHPSWLSATRPVALGASTVTGALGWFRFPVLASKVSSRVTVEEGFVPVLDGSVSLRSRGAATWTIDPAHAPTARITSAPAYITDTSTAYIATVGLGSSDPSPGSGVAYVEVERRAPGETAWSVPVRVTVTATHLGLRGAGAHQVRIRAVDRANHASPWTAPRTIVVPRDDTDASLTFSGDWTSAAPSGSWLGSVATAGEGASVETPVNGASYAVIGTRAADAAPLSVYLDDALVTVVDPAADTTAQRQVLWQSALPPGDHVLRVVVGDVTASGVSAESAEVAYLDAIAVA
jgi:hypothetical protein